MRAAAAGSGRVRMLRSVSSMWHARTSARRGALSIGAAPVALLRGVKAADLPAEQPTAFRHTDAPGFIAAQALGATAATLLFRWLLAGPEPRA